MNGDVQAQISDTSFEGHVTINEAAVVERKSCQGPIEIDDVDIGPTFGTEYVAISVNLCTEAPTQAVFPKREDEILGPTS